MPVGKISDPGVVAECVVDRSVLSPRVGEELGEALGEGCMPEPRGAPEGCPRPSPIVTFIEAEKIAQSASSHGNSEPTQGLSGWCQAIQSQRRRSALPKRCRLGMPRPPCSVGAHIVGQLTLQLAPVISSSWRQRKRRLHLLISLRSIYELLGGSSCMLIVLQGFLCSKN